MQTVRLILHCQAFCWGPYSVWANTCIASRGRRKTHRIWLSFPWGLSGMFSSNCDHEVPKWSYRLCRQNNLKSTCWLSSNELCFKKEITFNTELVFILV